MANHKQDQNIVLCSVKHNDHHPLRIPTKPDATLKVTRDNHFASGLTFPKFLGCFVSRTAFISTCTYHGSKFRFREAIQSHDIFHSQGHVNILQVTSINSTHIITILIHYRKQKQR